MRSVTFPAPGPVWSTNEDRRLFWAVRAERIKLWHDAAFWIAKQQGWNHPSQNNRPSTVRMTFTFPTARRRDSSNLVGTVVKASVDGLVAAGVFPDDTSEWVEVLEPRILAPIEGRHMVTLTLEDRL